MCPMCFAHEYVLDQLDISHTAFDFCTLPKLPTDCDSEVKHVVDKFEQSKGVWTKLPIERPKVTG
jgi:hypothetical protein